jgi:hypothetical protein
MIPPVINLYRTKEEAFYFRNSQLNNIYLFGGIHLLPMNPIRYVQVTDTPDGINLEDWIVKVKTLDDKTERDITYNFAVIGQTNSENGNPQVIWHLYNIPFDAGYQLVYLEIMQSDGEFFYSNPFRLTRIYADKTVQFHYKYDRTDILQSIGFQTWFRAESEKVELTTYYEESTQHTVTQAVKVDLIENYATEPMASHELRLLSMVLRSPYLYVNSVRASLYEAITFPDAKGTSNINGFTYPLSPKKSDVLKLEDIAIISPR